MKSALKQDKGSFQRFVYLGQNSSSVTDPRCNFNLQGYFYQVYIHCICNAVCVTVFKVETGDREDLLLSFLPEKKVGMKIRVLVK